MKSPQNFINNSPRSTNMPWNAHPQQYLSGYEQNILYGNQVPMQQYNPYGQQHFQIGAIGQQVHVHQHMQPMYQTEMVPQMQNVLQTENMPMPMLQTEMAPQMHTMMQTEIIPMQVQEMQTIMLQEPFVEMVPVPIHVQQV
jgi:hypothetical protein